MKILNKIQLEAYADGYSDGIKDCDKNKKRKYNKNNELEVISKIYDLYYIKGYIKAQKNRNISKFVEK